MAKDFGRNVVLSGLSWLLPSVVAVVAVPITVRGLGPSAYGVVALAGAVTGYLGVLDVGLGQGVVRYLSVCVSLEHGRAMRHLLRRVLAWFVAAGVLGSGVMWVLAPWLTGSLLKVPPALAEQSVAAFRLGGVAFALGMVVSVLTFVPTAFLRYDLVSALSVTLGSLTLVGPAVLVTLGYGLVPVMWFSVVANLAACACWGVVAVRLVRSVPNEGPPLSEYWRGFLGFSAKNGANRILSAVQGPTSQLVVGIAGGVTAAAYFQVPMLISNKVSELLSRLSTVLLPTGSQMAAEGEHDLLLALYERSSRLFYVLNAATVGSLVVFAAPLLRSWIGPRYAEEGAVAFALLTLAAGLNAASMAASQVNMALGRPGVNLAFSTANSAINLGTVYWLTVAFGIAGTALSGLLAAAVVPFFLHYSHRKVLSASSWQVFRDCYLRTTLAVAAVMIVAWFVLRPMASGFAVTLVLVTVMGGACLLACAAFGSLTPDDMASLKWAVRSALFRGPRDAQGGPAADGGESHG